MGADVVVGSVVDEEVVLADVVVGSEVDVFDEDVVLTESVVVGWSPSVVVVTDVPLQAASTSTTSTAARPRMRTGPSRLIWIEASWRSWYPFQDPPAWSLFGCRLDTGLGPRFGDPRVCVDTWRLSPGHPVCRPSATPSRRTPPPPPQVDRDGDKQQKTEENRP